jgi:tryptophanyl-tRNA synthetase
MRPTGRMHIGHYHGALKNWVRLQQEYECYFFVADWHALTTNYESPEVMKESLWEMVIDWLAAGLDPAQCAIFIQSRVPEHAELTLLLGMITSVGWLERVPTYKEMQQQLEDRDLSTYGFLGYPVLQAADILLYHADKVPVGDDQRQHLELARDIAERFNARFGETFVVPEGVYPEVGARIMDLQEPTKKMSTTGGSAQGTVLMLDEPDVVRKKIKSAVTDSGRDVRRGEGKEGIENLITIMSVATGEPLDAIESRYDGAGYGDFKSDVAEAVVEMNAPIQARYRELRDDPAELYRLLAMGAEKAHAVSAPTLALMYERMGFAKS